MIDSCPFALGCLCVLVLPLVIGLLFSVAYIASFLYGVFTAQPLPSREIFLFLPALSAIFSQPPTLAKAILGYAFAGMVLSRVVQREAQPEFGRHFLAALGRHWNIVSLLSIFSLLFATLGMVHFSYDTTTNFHNSITEFFPSADYYSLAGLLPFSDADGHYLNYTKYFYDGIMGDWVLRRPVAAFMGASIHWLAGNVPAFALLLRCLLVSCAIWATCAVMNKSFGVWSAIGCLALEYSYIYTHLPLFSTETLGFFWGGSAAALWLHALRDKRLFWDLAAFSVTLAGLLTRMGAMFLVPAFFFYVLWRWRELRPIRGWWKKPLLGLFLCVAIIAALNAAFSSRGAGDTQQTGSNFSYSFAGLTLGTNWGGAKIQYLEQLNHLIGEKQKSRFLYKQGVKNILRSPEVFFKRLAAGEWGFIKNFNFFLLDNWYLVWLLGGLLLLRHKTLFSRLSGAFWISVWGGILLSIPFIYFDESWRVNIFVYPFIACFFSLALGQRVNEIGASGRHIGAAAPWVAVTLSWGLLLLMTSVAVFPHLHTATEIQKIQKYVASLPKRPPNMCLVEANGMGFLVVPDGETLDTTVPSMTWSTFRDRYQKFVHSAESPLFTSGFPAPPFAVLNQIPVIGSDNWGFFIAPPKVLTQKNVLLWDLEIGREAMDTAKGFPWKIVSKAVPVLYK